MSDAIIKYENYDEGILIAVDNDRTIVAGVDKVTSILKQHFAEEEETLWIHEWWEEDAPDSCGSENKTHTRLFHPSFHPEQILASFDSPMGYHCQHEHDCCGNWYPSGVVVQEVRIHSRRYRVGIQSWTRNV